MAKLPKPEKPFNILTIDGGGLQGISTLLILDKLLDAIARNNDVPDGKPRPCDVFDVIAGIGPGGWLALLLGRFQMDVSSALAEWYNLIDCITPRSKTEEFRMRLLQNSYFDPERLVEQIDQMADFYETGKHMFFTPPSGTRCKHVFVSALQTDSKGASGGYHLFRTYQCPAGVKVLPGPEDSRQYKISHAFGATGAARYFTPPWKETSAKKGKMKFLDSQFPSPHNITELALDEIWGLYGTDVKVSVVVNIGPGIPNAADCKSIARRFSWGRKDNMANQVTLPSSQAPVASQIATRGARSQENDPASKPSKNGHRDPHPVTFDPEIPAKAGHAERQKPMTRHTTFGSERNVDIEVKLKRDEDEIEDHIRKKLRNIYGEKFPPYYRLAPDKSAPGTALNDTNSPKQSFDSTTDYLRMPRVVIHMDEVGQRIPIKIPLLVG